jgi:hypothetical protein
MNADLLIQQLIEQTKHILKEAEKLKALDPNTLAWKQEPNSWNVLECLEHLNLYGDFYFPQMENSIKNAVTQPDVIFNSGLLGNFFSQSMLPKKKLFRMKAFKDKNPLNANLNLAVIDRFIFQQIKLLELLR